MYSVLIVDDEPLLRNAIRDLLPWEEYGFTVRGEAGDGKTALGFIYDKAPDLLLTDIVMPEMDGLELLKTAKLRFPKIKVIMLSSYDEFRYVRRALQFGADDYILKPTLDAGSLLLLLKQLFPQSDREGVMAKGGAAPCCLISRGSPVNLAAVLTKGMNPHARLEVQAALEPLLRETGVHRLRETDAEVFLLEHGPGAALAEEFLLTSGVTGMVIRNITSQGDLEELLENFSYLKAFPFFMPYCHVLVSEPSELLPFSKSSPGEADHDPMVALPQFLLFLQNVTLRDRVTPQQLKLKAETVLYDFFVKMEDTEEYLPLLERITFAESVAELRDAYSFFYSKIMEALKSKRVSPTLMDQIICFIENNYNRNISLHDVADNLHFNYSYLSHYFNTQSTINFKEYLNNVRIEKAKHLLAEDGFSISAVCFRTGFADHAYFSRVFHRITGLTPTDYRSLAACSGKEGGA